MIERKMKLVFVDPGFEGPPKIIPFMENMWGDKMRAAAFCKGSIWDALGEPTPPPSFWKRTRKALAYHLFHRWKTLRFGFYRVCTCREDW